MSKMHLCDLAEKFGISISQVSRALGNKPGVESKLRAKIIAEAGRAAYRNDNNAHVRKAAVVFRNIPENTAEELRKLRNRFRRKKKQVLYLLPDSADFLDDYVVDEIILFNLPPEDIAHFRKQHKLLLSKTQVFNPKLY